MDNSNGMAAAGAPAVPSAGFQFGAGAGGSAVGGFAFGQQQQQQPAASGFGSFGGAPASQPAFGGFAGGQMGAPAFGSQPAAPAFGEWVPACLPGYLSVHWLVQRSSATQNHVPCLISRLVFPCRRPTAAGSSWLWRWRTYFCLWHWRASTAARWHGAQQSIWWWHGRRRI